ncbi:hypothetical protein SDC9_58668 [bioreactor metagenome]|uniref:Uncharacterized protein n=1 Tax=bioreactor metagenome TaxID=1076179 RepID=A0A644X810_9ZZZZ
MGEQLGLKRAKFINLPPFVGFEYLLHCVEAELKCPVLKHEVVQKRPLLRTLPLIGLQVFVQDIQNFVDIPFYFRDSDSHLHLVLFQIKHVIRGNTVECLFMFLDKLLSISAAHHPGGECNKVFYLISVAFYHICRNC